MKMNSASFVKYKQVRAISEVNKWDNSNLVQGWWNSLISNEMLGQNIENKAWV